jgi:hypothetical protein
MGREKRNLPTVAAGGPKERHRRAQRSQYDPKAPVPEGFVAKPAVPKSKHHSYLEFVENTEKKKKLEFKVDEVRLRDGKGAHTTSRLLQTRRHRPDSNLYPSVILS